MKYTTEIFPASAGAHAMLVLVPDAIWPAQRALLDKSAAKHSGYLTLDVSLPHKPRSTGPRSINNRIHGHCEDLEQQLPPNEQGVKFTADDIYKAMKRMAVSEGYPTWLSLDGNEEPLPMRYSSQDQAGIVNKVIQRFADQNDFWLTDYDESVKPPVAYKSKGGRTRQEMEAIHTGEGI